MICGLELQCTIEPEDAWYVSYCEQLGIASQGESEEEAEKNLQEAIEMFFEDASVNEILGLLSDLEPDALVEFQHHSQGQIARHRQASATQWELQVA